jgi:hypothetical protein
VRLFLEDKRQGGGGPMTTMSGGGGARRGNLQSVVKRSKGQRWLWRRTAVLEAPFI